MKKLKAAIFDMDGTLIDSMYVWEEAGDKLLDKYQIEVTDELRKRMIAMTFHQLTDYLNEHYHLQKTVDELTDEICRLVEDEYFYRVSAKAYAEETLRWLSDHEIVICVLTASERYYVEAACRRLRLMPYFDKLYTCSEIGLSKRDPEIFHQVLQELDVKPDEAVVFEDAIHAIKTASASGIYTIAVDDRFNREHTRELRETADGFIVDYREVPKLLQELVE